MAGAAMSAAAPRIEPDLADIQGLVRFSHARLSEASFLLLRIADRAAAGAWLAAAPVTTARAADPLPEVALQVAFTRPGLQAIGLAQHAIAGFSAEFISGMAGDENRSRRLGDVGINAPANWEWGVAGREPHVLVLIYALPGRLAAWQASLQDDAWTRGFYLMATLTTVDLGGIEPFGFRDGISQPTIDWTGQRRATPHARVDYGNLLSLGEILLGYPNEYGQLTDRPLLDPADDPGGLLPAAPDSPAQRDLGLNGTYLVLRDLQQDVRGFWRYLDGQAGGSATERRQLAEAMVGRRMSGDPLMPLAAGPIDGIGAGEEDRLNRFTYRADPAGMRCPLGAHVRRANPRTADLPDGATNFFARLTRVLGFGIRGPRDDLIAATRFHRILRCGREYGPLLTQDDALRPAPEAGHQGEEKRGLRFICLNANITRQFEFVQNAWIARSKFDGLSGESDPLLGNRDPIPGCPVTDGFSIPRPGAPNRRLAHVPRFVAVRGGAYFFLPGVRALGFIAGVGRRP
jgi:deferrochelatase/peroxidase EfeB